MSSNESSSWMSTALMPGGVSVSDCCNGFISWWTGGGTTEESANDNEESATSLVEPLLLVEEQVAQVMDEEERIQIVVSDLFLDEMGDDETQSSALLAVGDASPEQSLDIENPLSVMNDNESVRSQLDVFAGEDEHDQDETKSSSPLTEKGGSSEPVDIENNAIVTPRNDESMPLQSSEVFDDEPEKSAFEPFETKSNPLMKRGGPSEPLDIEKNALLNPHNDDSMPQEPEVFDDELEQDEPQATTVTTVQSSCNDGYQEDEAHASAMVEESSSETLDTEHHLATEIQPALFDDENDLTAVVHRSIFRRTALQPSDERDSPVLYDDESMQAEHDAFDDEHVTTTSNLSTNLSTSPVKSEPLDFENQLSTKIQPTTHGAATSSIFRRSASQPFDESDTPILDEDESIQAEQHTFEDDHETNCTTLSMTSLVKKRVSGLIAIFESLSTDEGEENVTPTSLCSSSSFSAPKSAQDTCPCCNNKIYPTDATIAYHEKIFHGGCFKCHLCDRKFSRGMSEVAGMIPHDAKDDSNECMLSCTKCRDDAAVKHLPLRKSTPACQPITIASPEKGNIQQVKDEIGDDLESVMDGMIPCCSICGIHFLGGGESSDMMILGMNKYHRKCRMYGRPMVERCERKVLPIVAANYAPESLVVRISNTSSESSTKEIMTTLYFMLPDKAADLQRVRNAERPNENVNFEYVMDSSAYANPNYDGTKKNAKTTFPCHGVGIAGRSISVGFLGDPLGLPIQLVNARIEDRDGRNVFCAEMECFKFQLRHRFDLVMHTTEESSVDLKTATLSMNIAG